MDEENKFMLNIIFSGILIITIFITIIMLGGQWFKINIYDVVPITAIVDNKIVYQGKSGCIEVNSAGRTTTVTVLGGFMCYFPQKNMFQKMFI